MEPQIFDEVRDLRVGVFGFGMSHLFVLLLGIRVCILALQAADRYPQRATFILHGLFLGVPND